MKWKSTFGYTWINVTGFDSGSTWNTGHFYAKKKPRNDLYAGEQKHQNGPGNQMILKLRLESSKFFR